MFGYVRPVKEKLSPESQKDYEAAYCGLCRCLGKQYGFFYRFFVNYDFAFLYLLFSSSQEVQETQWCRCPNGVCKKKHCFLVDDTMQFAADMDVLLTYWKFCDTIRDDGCIKSWMGRLGKKILSKNYRCIQNRYREIAHLFEAQMRRLWQLEENKSDSIDATSDTFAQILCSCALYFPEGIERRIFTQLLYHLGRYIYLVDAVDDLQHDYQSKDYNPLLLRFEAAEAGTLRSEEQAYLKNIIDCSISAIAAAYELLPLESHRVILENIIYFGLPAMMHSVFLNDKRKKKKGFRNERSL